MPTEPLQLLVGAPTGHSDRDAYMASGLFQLWLLVSAVPTPPQYSCTPRSSDGERSITAHGVPQLGRALRAQEADGAYGRPADPLFGREPGPIPAGRFVLTHQAD
jgi:hypothetical protein